MSQEECMPVRLLAGLQPGAILLHRPDEPLVLARPAPCCLREVVRGEVLGPGSTHGAPPSEPRSRPTARAHRFFTLFRERPMRRATSGKLSPSRWDRIITSR